MLAQLSLVYPARNLTEAEAKMLVDMWQEDLAGFSAPVVVEAFRQYRQDANNKFFPHPGAIIGIANRIPDPGYAKALAKLRAENETR